ncbi:putative transposase-associated domain-containing protein [Tanacetum coccineum]
MDTSWMYLKDRTSSQFTKGVELFLDSIFSDVGPGSFKKCPCSRCGGRFYKTRDDMKDDLIVGGFMENYLPWSFMHNFETQRDNDQNEEVITNIKRDDIVGMVQDAMGILNVAESADVDEGMMDDETLKVFKMLKDGQRPLFKGSKRFTSLSFITRLLHIKVLGGWSNKSCTMVLELFLEALEEIGDVVMPKSYYEANKIVSELGFSYETWDACPNDCMLFRGDDKFLDSCSICEASRYKKFNSDKQDDGDDLIPKRKIPAKQERVDDGLMRHPADSPAWKMFDKKYLEFGCESRNVRLGLASDGFNPFRTMTISHSTWPVVLIPYNLPSWLCMKQPSFILYVLIDGPKAHGDKIDAYLQPLIDELKDLWHDGVSTYDASSKKRDPRPRVLLGSELLDQLKDVETVYKKEDVFKKRKREELEKENERVRKVALRSEKRKMKEKMKGKGKMNVKVKQKTTNSNEKEGDEHERQDNWKKKSIFFELVYWDFLPIRHNLDVMHIEKNVCDNVLFTLLGVAGKTKDHLNARLDLKELNIRPSLHPQETNSSRILLPPACFTLGKDEKYRFLKLLKDLKVPDGYASNISRCVHLKELSIWGLKSHDNHIILQQLLPLAVRRLLPKHVVEALIELSNFFRILCSKVNSKYDLQKLQDRISLTLCHLEKIFPPSFFDIMEHLPIHLAEEVLLVGPIQYRWMYPIERYLLTLKMYVRNRARPEGCIAKGALMEECMTFCARYLKDIETKSTRPDQNYSGEDNMGSHFGIETPFFLDHLSMEQAHRYLLASTDAVAPYRERHLQSLQKFAPRERQRLHNKDFPSWFRADKKKVLTTEIIDIAMGLTNMAKRYNGYVVNGFRFRKKSMDNSRVTQNSGVIVIASTISFSSRKDKNLMSGELTYYGKLTYIIEVRYTDETKFVLFKCNWVDNRTGVKVDNFGITLVNFSHLLYKENNPTDEPFILASQAKQVMYVEDPIDPEWEVAIKMTSRDTFDMDKEENSNTIGAARSSTIKNQQQNNLVYVVESDSDEEIEDELEAHISDESEEEFDDTIDYTSDNDGVRNMRDDESDDD